MLDTYYESEKGADYGLVLRVASMGHFPPQAVRRSIEYIHANLAGAIRLRDIAGAVGMSMFHLSRTFRASTGLTLHRYLTRARVEKVKALLLDSDRSLAAIADATGFSDESHMSKTFRRFTGTTPRLFRHIRRPHHSAMR
ncbi:MAG TPA: AraC family transcriptional regulator [Burkholderiales bacterium]|jgi:AraC family transcriptional regulator|nr:AraC family transcriptional regulator [Burkholderiales bacterium]